MKLIHFLSILLLLTLSLVNCNENTTALPFGSINCKEGDDEPCKVLGTDGCCVYTMGFDNGVLVDGYSCAL